MQTTTSPRLSPLTLILRVAFAGAAATSVAAHAQSNPGDAVPVVTVTGQTQTGDYLTKRTTAGSKTDTALALPRKIGESRLPSPLAMLMPGT